ncbi:MAG: hypothetical protein HC769_36225 [Cyanobacteria bacterium CRU_2_1]|nr:hypothetical protein [Cyanobacteria bacterium CRU_2_1]
MLQQLHLFAKDLDHEEPNPSSPNGLVDETRQLFQHQGSNSELVERIMNAVRAIDALSEKTATSNLI